MAAAPGAMRARLRGLFLFGATGTAAELLLLGHVEGAWQVVPLALLGAGSLAVAAMWTARSAILRHVVRLLMAACIVSGGAGVLLHYSGNVEFERELQADVEGWALVREAMTGATPVLAPGTMALLGVIGLLGVEPRDRE